MKIWKQSLGFVKKNQAINFSYPDEITHKTFKNIQKDITRTYPQLTFFTHHKSNLELFDHTLRKIAVYFPRVGYTQGMNFLVGFFLLSGLSQNDTFTMCVKILTNYDLMCLGLYEDQFPLNRLYCALVWEVLNARKPAIKQKFKTFAITDEAWLFQWFMTFFIYSFPFEIISELWTFLFLKKQFAFVSIASAIVLIIWPDIEKCQNQFDFLAITDQLKSYQNFSKRIKIQQLIKIANSISNYEIKKLIEQTQVKGCNKYYQYFILDQNDKKIKCLQILGKLSQERQKFLKNPQEYDFNRNQNQISMLDSIQYQQARMMYNSLKIERKSIGANVHQNNSKLWKSDLQKFNADFPSADSKKEQVNEEKKEQEKDIGKCNLNLKRTQSNG